jgi:di/tricarboxylate transporter
MLAVLGVLALTLFLFISEIVRVDVAAILVMVILGVSGLVGPNEVFSGFASNAVISIIAVMILGAALDKTGVMNRVAQPIVRLAGRHEARLIAFVSAAVGLISSFMQNIAAAALFLPAVNRIALRTGIPVSRLLMPMGFCAILGGTVTLVGSSPLILLNDLVAAANANLPPGTPPIERFRLFEVTPVGLVLIATGILYFILLGRRILPAVSAAPGETPSTLEYLTRTYKLEGSLYELVVPPTSALIGQNIEGLRAHSGYRLSTVVLERDGRVLFAPPRDTVLAAGDVLGVFGPEALVREFAARFGLEQREDLHSFAEVLSPTQAGIAELVLPPRSSLIGKTMRELQFRRRYRATLLAIYRAGTVLTERLSDIPFQSGDALLVHSRWEDLALLEKGDDFIVKKEGIAAEGEVSHGPSPHAMILAAARQCQADLIVLGSHGRSGLERVLLGSTTERVINGTSGAVLVVKPG